MFVRLEPLLSFIAAPGFWVYGGDNYSDAGGYPSTQRSEVFGTFGYREHIQRKAKSGKPLRTHQ